MVETNQDISNRVIQYAKRLERVLEGKVTIQGKDVIFNPAIDSSRADRNQIGALKRYIGSDELVDVRGHIFFPEGEFSLNICPETLALYLESKKKWGESMAIYVFDRSIPDTLQTEIMEILSQDAGLESFIHGKFRERKNDGQYTIVRRYYKE